MIGVYSAPATGYVQCWPTRDMGKDRAAAIYLVGVTAESLPGAKLSGWLAIPDGGEPIRLQAGSASEARRACVPLAPVTLCRGVAHGRAYLYERRERLLPLSPSQAVKDKGLSLVAPGTGVLVAKAFNPRNARDLRVLASQLANQLTPLDFQAAKDALEQALQRLDVNWPALSQSQSSKVWREADRVLKQVLKSAHGEMLPTYVQRITVSLEDIAASTRAALHSSFLPRIGTSLEQRDVRAVERIAHQQGWWVRDEWGVRSDKLTERGRSIVQRGLADGLGRAEIGADLRRAMPEMWAKMGDTYAKLNAGMATSRGRSYSELSSYQEAGISRFEIVAVIDEATTDCCRALDGQIISVGAAAALQEQQMHLSEPEDIRTVSPLINTVRSDGRTFLETANGDRISEVMRSGYGVVDDRGQNSYSRMGDQLAAAGIGLSPYHLNCRSLSVPRTDMVSVPSGFTPVAASGPAPTTSASLKVKAAPDIETPEAAFELRPLELVPLPKRDEPVIHGTGSMLDEVPLPQEFGSATSGLHRWYGDTGKMEFAERPHVDLGDDPAADLARAENLIPAGDGHVLLDLAVGDVRLCAAVIASRDDVAHREVLLRARGLWVRFSGSQVPYQARRKFRRGFDAGEPDPEPLMAVVGRVGLSLDEVAVARSERVATGSTTERKRRPSWSDPVLLPGVPLEEQVAKRTNRVRAELKARIDSAIHRERYLRGDEDERAGGDLPLLPKEDRAGIVAREIRAALRLHAEHGHASKRVVALFDGEPPSDPAEAMTALQGLGVHADVAALLLRSAVDDGVVVGSMLPGRTMDLADMRVREPVLADGAWHSRDEYREALVDEPGRVLIAAAARIGEDDRELALSWETFPEQIAAYVSVMRGHYVR